MNGLNILFGEELLCVNVGIDIFSKAVAEQNVKCAQVEWKPPAGGDMRLIKILEWLEG